MDAQAGDAADVRLIVARCDPERRSTQIDVPTVVVEAVPFVVDAARDGDVDDRRVVACARVDGRHGRRLRRGRGGLDRVRHLRRRRRRRLTERRRRGAGLRHGVAAQHDALRRERERQLVGRLRGQQHAAGAGRKGKDDDGRRRARRAVCHEIDRVETGRAERAARVERRGDPRERERQAIAARHRLAVAERGRAVQRHGRRAAVAAHVQRAELRLQHGRSAVGDRVDVERAGDGEQGYIHVAAGLVWGKRRGRRNAARDDPRVADG